MIAASACVDNDEQEEEYDDVFLPNIENIERKTRQSSLHHSDSRSSGIFSQVFNFDIHYIWCNMIVITG